MEAAFIAFMMLSSASLLASDRFFLSIATIVLMGFVMEIASTESFIESSSPITVMLGLLLFFITTGAFFINRYVEPRRVNRFVTR